MTPTSRPTQPETSCVSIIVSILVEAYVVMMFLGAGHSVAHSVPAVGYGTSVVAVLALNWTTNRVRRAIK